MTILYKPHTGRPRTVSFSPEDMIKLGEEMIEWIKENDPLHVSQWYSIHKCFTDKQWEAFQQVPEFHPYYERALKIIGLKYIDKNSNVRDGISHRWQRVYFKDLKREEDDTKRFESQLKKEEAASVSQEIAASYESYINQMKALQEAKKESK